MCIAPELEAPQPGRRADSAQGAYAPVNPQFIGGGITKNCATCNTFKPMGTGWKRLARGMSCPPCAEARK